MVAACPVPARRGTPLRVERLAEALCAAGHQVELITYHVADDDAHPMDFPVHRIFHKPRYRRMVAGPSARKLFLYDPPLAMKVWQVVGRGGFDLIHAHHFEGLLVSLPARVRHRVPVIYDAHTMLRLELPSYGPRLSRWVTRAAGGWLDGSLPRAADHIVAVTPDIRDTLIERHGLSPDRITVVMNGVEANNFRVRGSPSRDAVRLIYSGTLAPYQDIDLLLDAFARARRIRKDLKLCFSVSSSFEPYEEQARRLGIRDSIEVIDDGFEQLPGRLAASNIAVLPRTACPGIPQKLLNYMAAGKAIVSSEGSAKVIEHERTGLIVPNGDADAFADALLRLADDPELARQLGDSARVDVESTYSWQQSAESLEGIYEQVLMRRKGLGSPESI